MIGVIVREQDGNDDAVADGFGDGVQMFRQVGSRIDDRDRGAADQIRPGAIQRERRGIGRADDPQAVALAQDRYASRRSATSTSASLSATRCTDSWSSSANASFFRESMSICPRMSSPARISTTISAFTDGEQAR